MRDDVLTRLDEWLLRSDGTRWVFISSGSGMGKSAILTAWLARHEASSTVAAGLFGRLFRRLAGSLARREVPPLGVPHHFIRQIAGWDQPEVIAGSLAAQIEVAFRRYATPTQSATPSLRLEAVTAWPTEPRGKRSNRPSSTPHATTTFLAGTR